MALPPLGNSDHVVVSVSIGFPINSKQDTPFHRVAYDYSRADWDSLRDHLRDVLWEDIFKLSAFAAASEFCEWVQVGIDVYIPHRKSYPSESISSRNLALVTLGEVLIVFSTKVNLFYLLYSTDQRCCLLHLINQNYAKNFSKNSNLDDSGISLPVFPSRTNVKLHNISITPKMVIKVIMNLQKRLVLIVFQW